MTAKVGGFFLAAHGKLTRPYHRGVTLDFSRPGKPNRQCCSSKLQQSLASRALGPLQSPMRSSSEQDVGGRIDEASYSGGLNYLLRNRHGCSTILRQPSSGRERQALHGAAKMSFVRKCKQDACASKAVSAEGKPLHGAAKKSYMRKCERGA